MLVSSVCPVSEVDGFYLPDASCTSLGVRELFLSVACPLGGIISGGNSRVSFLL